jgi:CheY-like chemotaxis protein
MDVKSKRVLVIDDEEEIVNAAKRMLERCGYTVATALNGKQGMDLVNESRPDVIITDIIMPIMDGYEFFKQLRKESFTAKIPVIILTARPNMEDSFRALGVNGFVTKPFTSENLIDKIEHLTTSGEKPAHRGAFLVAGAEEYSVNHMVILLKDEGYKADAAENAGEIVAKALDIMMTPVPSREIIKALRCFHKLDKTKIVLYTNFSPATPGAFDTLDYIQEAKQACMEAGANYYIGRFSHVNFINSLNNIRLSSN